MTSRRLARLLTIAVALLAIVGTSTALAATPRTSLYDVEDEVMCVSCGVPLVIAESPQADAERREIQRLVNRGLTKDQIKANLVDTYGDRVLAMPKDKGFGLAAYLVPIAIVLGALVALALVVPRWRRRRADAAATAGLNGFNNGAAPELSAAETQRLDADLARYDI